MQDEASARNMVLEKVYERIPSYALWTHSDIHRETIEQRKKWWRSFQYHADYTVAAGARRWLTHLGDHQQFQDAHPLISARASSPPSTSDEQMLRSVDEEQQT